MKPYKILTINPGSTSTKISIFQNKEILFSENISHSAEELKSYKEIKDQLPYRESMILDFLSEHQVSLDNFSAVVGRGGGLMAVEGGVYEINNTLLEHARTEVNGVHHPASLGPQLAKKFADNFHCPAYVVNPPDTDELQPLARITGIKDVYRNVHLHALNLKETAIHHSELNGKRYEDCNYIVCHIGGGISVSAHRKGRMVDGNDIVGGEGPMSPTRCGSVPVTEVIRYCFSGISETEARALCTKSGGFVNLLGTSNAIEVYENSKSGDTTSYMAWNGMIYQIEKEIGAMAAVLHGNVDAILLSGGMVYNTDLVNQITEACSYIAPITTYPGEFEMEAMAAGAIRVLEGTEHAKTYTGKPVWDDSFMTTKIKMELQ